MHDFSRTLSKLHQIPTNLNRLMDLFHMATILSPKGLKTFVLRPLNSLPNTSTRRLGYELFDQHGRRVRTKVHCASCTCCDLSK